METIEIKSRLLGLLNDRLDVVAFDEGFLVFAPLHFSDDDAVTLYARPESGGWLVTDQASTMLRHHALGTPVESPRFVEGWNSIAVSQGFVPGGADDGAIEAWGGEDELPKLLLEVAHRAVRAEELRWIGSGRPRRSFSTNVMTRARTAFAGLRTRPGVDMRERARLRSTSGRERLITGAVYEDDTVQLAIQAVGGGSREAREQAYEHCYAIFGNSSVEQHARLAVAIGTPEGWDSGVLEELRSVTDVVFYGEPLAVESAIRERVPPELVDA